MKERGARPQTTERLSRARLCSAASRHQRNRSHSPRRALRGPHGVFTRPLVCDEGVPTWAIYIAPTKRLKVRFMGHHVREYSGVFKPTSVSGSLPYRFPSSIFGCTPTLCVSQYGGTTRYWVKPQSGTDPSSPNTPLPIPQRIVGFQLGSRGQTDPRGEYYLRAGVITTLSKLHLCCGS